MDTESIDSLLENKDAGEADVVVIGSGFAGLAAAVEAASAGASVLVIEKRKSCGGNSIVSSGVWAAAGTSLQRKHQIQDAAELLYQDILKAGRGRCEEGLAKIVADESRAVFEWTIDELGVQYKDRVDQAGGHSIPRSYTPYNASGTAIIKPLLAKAKALGVTIKTQTELIRVLTGKKGEIRAITFCSINSALEDKKQEYLFIKKALVLATGGFAGDVAFRSLQDPRLNASIEDTNRPGTTAEALREAVRIGGQAIDLDCIQLAPWSCPDEKGFGVGALLASRAVSPYGLLIDPTTGKRFVNELADRKTRADAILKIKQPCIGIVDSNGLTHSAYTMTNPDYDIAKYIKRGLIKKSNTVDELAAAYEIPLAQLEANLEAFNQAVSHGKDLEFRKPIIKAALPLSPPYYTIRIWPKVHYTMGGLKIDGHAQVIATNGDPIPRLYAAGEVTGGIHGSSRLADCAMTDCLVFGRIAGRNAALENPSIL